MIFHLLIAAAIWQPLLLTKTGHIRGGPCVRVARERSSLRGLLAPIVNVIGDSRASTRRIGARETAFTMNLHTMRESEARSYGVERRPRTRDRKLCSKKSEFLFLFFLSFFIFFFFFLAIYRSRFFIAASSYDRSGVYRIATARETHEMELEVIFNRREIKSSLASRLAVGKNR